MTTISQKKSNDAFAYLLSDQSPNARLVRVAALSNFQIGLPESPAELQLTGRLTVSSISVSILPGETIVTPDYITFLSLEISQVEQSLSRVIVLTPANPRQGQLFYVKDELGNADKCEIIITPNSNDIIKVINNKFGCVGFIWSGTSWSVLSDFKNTSNDASSNQLQDLISSFGSSLIDPSYVVLETTSTLANERVLTAGSGITITDGGPGGSVTISASSGGGDVTGPASSTDNAVVRFNLTTGKLIQNSGVTIDDSDNVSVPGRITVTGGTTTNTDATLGNAAVGSFPYYDGTLPSSFALFGHKDLNHAYSAISDAGSKNYALVQDSSGNTYVNAVSSSYVTLRCNNVSMVGLSNDWLGTGIPAIFATGDLLVPTRTDVFLGNYSGASATTVYAGTGDLNVGHNSADRTVNLGTGANTSEQEVTVGSTYGRSPLVLRAGTGNMYLTGAISTDFIIGHTAGTGDITLGRSTASNTIRIGNANTATGNTQTINIGAGTPAGTGKAVITIGNKNDASSTTINAGTGNINLDSALNVSVSVDNVFTVNGYSGNDYLSAGDAIFFGPYVRLTGPNNTSTITYVGNSTGASPTYIFGGSSGILLSCSAGYTQITGSTSNTAEAVIGAAEIGELPATRTTFPSVYAFFGHKTLDHSSDGNYALVQSNAGDTFLGAASSRTISFKNGTDFVGSLDHDTVSFTGKSGTATTTTIGNTSGASSLTLDAGTGDIDIGTSNSSRTINIGSSGSAGATIKIAPGVTSSGLIEIALSSSFYNKVRIADGGSSTGHEVYINTGNDGAIANPISTASPGGYAVTKIGTLNDESRVTIGSTSGASITTINAGSGGLLLSSSAGYTQITGSNLGASGYADAFIGNVEIGTSPLGASYAMFGHKDYDHSQGNYALLQDSPAGTKNTRLNAPTGGKIYFSNNNSDLGYLSDSEIYITGKSGTVQAVSIGSAFSSSSISINAGTGGVDIGTINAAKTINIGPNPISTCTTQQDVHIASKNTTSFNRAYICDGDSNTGHEVYILSNNGTQTTVASAGVIEIGTVNAATTIDIGSSTSGTKTTTIGNVAASSSTTIQAGSGGLLLTSSAGYTTITGSTSTTTEAIIGMAAVGELPATRVSFPSYFSMFGHKNLDQSTLWNYAVVQNGAPAGVAGRGDTFINSPSTIYFQFSGSSGGTVGILDNNTVSFTGLSSTATTTTIGNTASTSTTTINAGSGDILISASLGDVVLGTPNIRSTGRVGIGTSTPSYKLDVQTDIAAGWAAGFFNDGNSTNRYGIRIQSGTDTTTGDLIDFYDGDGTLQGTISFNAGTVTYGAFTGDHYARINDVYTEKVYGTIVKVVSTNSEPGRKNINYVVEKTTSAKDPAVFGVYAASLDASPDENLRDCHSIFSLGDGHILVTDEGGNIEIGDYICSSNTPGHGMKQDDDLLHSYTVAKATQTVDFSTEQPGPNGYKSVLITCTYHAS